METYGSAEDSAERGMFHVLSEDVNNLTDRVRGADSKASSIEEEEVDQSLGVERGTASKGKSRGVGRPRGRPKAAVKVEDVRVSVNYFRRLMLAYV